MVRDDLQACLQAYQFAELLLGSFSEKSDEERRQAIDAAVQLRDEARPLHEAAQRAGVYDAQQLSQLEAALGRIERRLSDARTTAPRSAVR